MVDRTGCNADDTPVFINNSSEISEVTCACYNTRKIELQKTLIDLRSAHNIIELLQEEINLNMPNRTVSTDVCYWHHNKNSTQLELKKGNWVHVLSSCQKRDSKPKVNYTLPIPTIANRYELLNNLNQPTNTTLNQRLEVKLKTEDRKFETKARRKHKVLITSDSHVRGCVAEVSPNLDEISKSQAL
jgi:hypothetical protein